MAAKLSLQRRQRSGRQQWFLDFMVNGKSLHDLVDAHDNVSCLGWLSSDDEQEFADYLTLLRKSPLASGRVPLYICGECGDLGCGAVTAQVREVDGYVEWSEFGYENNYDPEGPALTGYERIGPFRFERDEYRNVIEARFLTPGV